MWPCTCCLVCKKKIEAIRNHECGYSFIPSFVFSFELFRSVHLLSHNSICVCFNFQFCNFMFCEHQICIPLARRFYFFFFYTWSTVLISLQHLLIRMDCHFDDLCTLAKLIQNDIYYKKNNVIFFMDKYKK